MKLLVIAEQRQGKWNNTSFETLAAAQQIAAATSGTVSAVVVGRVWQRWRSSWRQKMWRKCCSLSTSCWRATRRMDIARG